MSLIHFQGRYVAATKMDTAEKGFFFFFLIETRHCGSSLAVATQWYLIIIPICYSRVPIDLVIGQMTAKDILFRS